jgi:hypothetical protein
MANLIDSTYFKGDILLTNKTDLASDISEAISRYEKEILINLLGYKTYKSMVASPTVEPYKSLIEGAEFEMTFDGITQLLKWEGLVNSDKLSLIAFYTYYKYQERNFVKPSAIGTVKAKAENAEVVTPIWKMVNAWNEMITMYGVFNNSWFAQSSAVIIKPDGGLIYNNNASAYNYLCANVDLFPDWIFTPLRSINLFML